MTKIERLNIDRRSLLKSKNYIRTKQPHTTTAVAARKVKTPIKTPVKVKNASTTKNSEALSDKK